MHFSVPDCNNHFRTKHKKYEGETYIIFAGIHYCPSCWETKGRGEDGVNSEPWRNLEKWPGELDSPFEEEALAWFCAHLPSTEGLLELRSVSLRRECGWWQPLFRCFVEGLEEQGLRFLRWRQPDRGGSFRSGGVWIALGSVGKARTVSYFCWNCWGSKKAAPKYASVAYWLLWIKVAWKASCVKGSSGLPPWHQDGHTDQWSRVESPEKIPHI